MSDKPKAPTILIQGVLKFPRLQVLDTEFGLPGNYTTLVTNLSEKAKTALESFGVEVKSSEEDGNYIRMASNAENKPKLVMNEGRELLDEGVKVASGTKVIIPAFIFTASNPKLKPMAKTSEFRIVDLVEYQGSDEEGEAL